MQPAQPGQGLELMLYGMGMVVAFLIVLVYATRLLSHIVVRFFPDPAPLQPAHREAARLPEVASLGDEAADPKLIAAVVAAVHAHRQRSQQ